MKIKYLVLLFMLVSGVCFGCSACDEWAKEHGGKTPKEIYDSGYKGGYDNYKRNRVINQEEKIYSCGWDAGYKQAEKEVK